MGDETLHVDGAPDQDRGGATAEEEQAAGVDLGARRGLPGAGSGEVEGGFRGAVACAMGGGRVVPPDGGRTEGAASERGRRSG